MSAHDTTRQQRRDPRRDELTSEDVQGIIALMRAGLDATIRGHTAPDGLQAFTVPAMRVRELRLEHKLRLHLQRRGTEPLGGGR